MKAIQELVAYFDRRGALSKRQIRKLLDHGLLAADAPANMVQLSNPLGASFYFRIKGQTEGQVWGTDTYTGDSALAVAADPQRYRPVATAAGLSDEDVRRATDYGSEIHRSWRRILQPLWMPAGLASPEARVQVRGRGSRSTTCARSGGSVSQSSPGWSRSGSAGCGRVTWRRSSTPAAPPARPRAP